MANYNNDEFITNSATNLIVNYLPQTMSDKELFNMFVTIGPVESCRVMKDFKTGYSYGFGFVNYTREEDAARAITQLNGLQVANKRIKVSYARPSGDDIKETNLYVTNLPKNINDNQLEGIFGRFGTIVQKNLLRDKLTGQPRGVAFIRFNLREEANEAIRCMDGTVPENGVEKLNVRIAEEHGKQKAAYYAGWQAGFNNRGGGNARGNPRGRGIPPVGRGIPPVGRGIPPVGRGIPPVGRGIPAVGRGVLGIRNPPAFNNQPPAYPLRAGGFGALRQDKGHHRYNPVGGFNAPGFNPYHGWN